MQTADIEFLILVVAALSLFGGVLGWASWEESRRTRSSASEQKRQTIKLDIRHVLAVLAGMVCFAVVFMYTGDADLLIAISSGLAASAASYLMASFALAAGNSEG